MEIGKWKMRICVKIRIEGLWEEWIRIKGNFCHLNFYDLKRKLVRNFFDSRFFILSYKFLNIKLIV